MMVKSINNVTKIESLFLEIDIPTFMQFPLVGPVQVTSNSATNAEQRFKYEKEKRTERIFNAKWCEGRPWLKYDCDENVMTCTICTKYGKRGESGNLKNGFLLD
jgi:hypothetical protein